MPPTLRPLAENPAHLFLGDHGVNNRDGVAKGRMQPWRYNSEKTSCVHGHPLTAANVYVTKDGHRHCRTCQRANEGRYRETRRAHGST